MLVFGSYLKDIQDKSVNRSMATLPVSALGNDALSTQGDQDRHHATVYNLRRKMNLSTYNVRPPNQKGKLENTKLEMA